MKTPQQQIDELVEKCKLTDEEWRKAWGEGRYYGAGDIGSTQNILKAQILKAIPFISEEIKRELEELTCIRDTDLFVEIDKVEWDTFWSQFQSPSGIEEK